MFLQSNHQRQLILASNSAGRAQLLRQVGLDFTISAVNFDEEAFRQQYSSLSAADMALKLAEAKACAATCDEAKIIIAGDQIMEIDGEIGTKSNNLDQARELLQRLSSKTHYLHSGISIRTESDIWSTVETASMTMRSLSKIFIDQYLDHVGLQILTSVGCYHYEGVGRHLFDKVSGDDSTIIGLPLLPLLNHLRNIGYLLS